MGDNGPYETAEQVRAVVARAYADTHSGRASLRTGGYAMLNAACSGAGVRTGAEDRHIMDWLAGIEIEACAVLASLITRAFEAGQAGSGPLPSAAAIRSWLAEHGWTVVSAGPGGSLHAPPDAQPVGVPAGDSDQVAIAGAVRRIAERAGMAEAGLLREMRELFRGDVAPPRESSAGESRKDNSVALRVPPDRRLDGFLNAARPAETLTVQGPLRGDA